MKKVTILDIAKELNITFSTVARALNDHPAISETTKKAVRETADRLNYRKNEIASSLRSGKSGIVGVIVPNLEVSFFSSVVHGIEKVMNQNGLNILLYQSSESFEMETKGIETFMKSRVDGIIASITTETFSYDAFREIVKRKIPLILFDRTINELDVPSVMIDDYRGGFIATEHLIQKGYKKIVHITDEHNVNIFIERHKGYLDALRCYNIPIDDKLIIRGNRSIELGKSAITSLVKEGVEFDAVFAVEDYTAMGAIQQLKDFKIKVPNKVGVIGFANESFGNLVSPNLSTIDQQTIRMGEEAANIFVKLSRLKKFYESKPEKIILDPIMIERDSSKKVKGSKHVAI